MKQYQQWHTFIHPPTLIQTHTRAHTQVSMLDPVIRLYPAAPTGDPLDFDEPEEQKGDLPAQTAILFSNTEPVLVVGDVTGAVHIFQINGLDLQPDLPVQAQIDRLKACMAENQP